MKVNRKHSKGFTLVEMLGVIVILGIIVAVAAGTVTRFIHKSRRVSTELEQKAIKMAAQSYLNANSNMMPKNIGEARIIYAYQLKVENYLKEDITNSDGVSCMEKSYVKVYKVSQNEYTYTSYVVCGDEVIEEITSANKPAFDLTFSNDKEVKNAKYKLIIYGDDVKDGDKHDPQLEILGYSYTVYILENGHEKQVYNSGTLPGNKRKEITINGSLRNYIDVTTATTFKVNATCTNVAGETASIEMSNNYNDKTFNDDVPPTCVYINNKAEGEPDAPDWINKHSPNPERTIGVYCTDGFGSGCKRNKFTKTWPVDKNNDGKLSISEKSVEFDSIEIYDNYNDLKTGNKEKGNRGLDTRLGNIGNKDCLVRVNLDLVAPSATLTAKNGDKTVADDVVVDDKHESKTLSADDYSDLVGENDKWMNAAVYPNGVKFTVKASDNMYLDHWTWETNPSESLTISKNRISTSNPDGASGNFNAKRLTSPDSSVIETFTVGLSAEGKRYGKLSVYDRAGNVVVINVYANIDRTGPPAPTFAATNIAQKTSYNFQPWSNDSTGVKVYVTGTGKDNVNSKHNDLSGHKYYKVSLEGGAFKKDDNVTITKNGTSTVTFLACDYAGNCGPSAQEKTVYLDNVPPVCTVSGGHDSWTNGSRTVTAVCSDVTSGCTASSGGSKNYSSEMNVTNAGAWGVGVIKQVEDQAHNKTDCPANQTVRIDKTPPSCTVSGGNTGWTNGSVPVTGVCRDNGTYQSGCTGNIGMTYSSEMSVTNAGTTGIGSNGIVRDHAGNTAQCNGFRPVHIDTTPPSFSCYMTSSGPRYYNQSDNLSGFSGFTGRIEPDSSFECGFKTYYGYGTARDLAGNYTAEKYCGSYTTDACPPEEDPSSPPPSNPGSNYSPPTVTPSTPSTIYPCRIGDTFTYTDSSGSAWNWSEGTAHRSDANNADALTVIGETDLMYQIGENRWIYKNCTSTSVVCTPAQCADLGREAPVPNNGGGY